MQGIKYMVSTIDTAPAISKTAFSCPHCNAHTTQQWSNLYAKEFSQDSRTPNIPHYSRIDEFKSDREISPEVKKALIEWVEKMSIGKPFIENGKDIWINHELMNLYITECFNCHEISIWVHDQLIYPCRKIDIQPNQDAPAYIRSLFDEAREIVGASPKGAAAILRLSIQYLCKELGESGDNIDKDIASLVAKGLNPLVQQALDIVRVIGNESVHPGEINLDDDRETALQLFNLFNLIVTQMISHPKQVNALYMGLPENKLKGIEQRNKKALDANNTK
jgi:hypothetical protein